ncbi:hypothetical protein KI387_020504 [Taxus chinensis]|uniref:BRX domain-containing protein n=1 Tax=Taxus chinensis TaxID=29808 RepID=A0AA38GC75_TAXCH|nr:hypothetical protein KI387_020504 [Taxus chinensis]
MCIIDLVPCLHFTPNGVLLPSVNDVAIAVETKGRGSNGFPVARNSTFPIADSNSTVFHSVVDGQLITDNKIFFQPDQDRSKESNMLYQTHSIDEAPRSGARDSMESKHDLEHETERVEQDEPGVFITLAHLPGGEKDLKRVRFSRKKFSEREAEHWWVENRARVYKHYNFRVVQIETKGTESNGFLVACISTFPIADSNGTVSHSVLDGPVITNDKISFQPVQDRSTESNMLYQTHNIDEAPRSGARDSMDSKHDHGHEREWVELDEPGVYITLAHLPGGEKDLKCVRFRYYIWCSPSFSDTIFWLIALSSDPD